MQVAAGFQALRQLGHQRRLDQAALVVFGLVPGVGEEDMHAIQAARREHVVDHFHRVMRADADVLQPHLADALEQRAHTGGMHLAAQKVGVRQGLRNLRAGLAHAKADFQYQRCLHVGPQGAHIGYRGLVWQQKLRPQLLHGPGLAGGAASGAQHIAFDGAQVGNGGEFGGGGWHAGAVGVARDFRSRCARARRRSTQPMHR